MGQKEPRFGGASRGCSSVVVAADDVAQSATVLMVRYIETVGMRRTGNSNAEMRVGGTGITNDRKGRQRTSGKIHIHMRLPDNTLFGADSPQE